MAKVVNAATPAAASGPRALTAADLGLGVRDERAARLPMAERPYKWAYAYLPERWQVLHGKVVPMLGVMFLVPGLNGGTTRRAVEAREERGWTVLDPMIDGESYIYECQSRSMSGVLQPLYLSRFEEAHEGSDHITCDSEGYAEWLAGLVDSGKIPKPAPYVLTTLRAQLKQRVSNMIDACRLTPSMSDLLEAAKADLEVVDAAIKSATSNAKPASKRPVASIE